MVVLALSPSARPPPRKAKVEVMAYATDDQMQGLASG
jgi:hypothetical protein